MHAEVSRNTRWGVLLIAVSALVGIGLAVFGIGKVVNKNREAC